MAGRRWLAVLSGMVITVVLGTMWARGLLAASVLQQLTTDPGTDMRPVWSPDGQRVAFQSNRSGSYSIWTMDADGQNERQVTTGSSDDRHPAWSPDGQQLAFDSSVSNSREIWIVDSDGQNLRQLTTLGARSNFPTWSPDGQQIAFYVYQDGTMNLWVVQIDGSNPQPLTLDLADERRNQCTFACHQAAWSPNGQHLAYEGGDHASVWLINADGSNPRELVSTEDHNHFPWFTDEGHIGYLTEHIVPGEAWTDAWVLDPASGEVTLLLDRIQLQGPLDWSPDGTKLLFHSPRNGNFDIYAANLMNEDERTALQMKPVLEAPSADSGVGGPAEAAEPDATASGAPEPAAPETGSGTGLAIPPLLGAIGLAGLIGIVGFIVILVVRTRRNPGA
ncbi:MAG: DPP IV N-terminal domain-containing protein [Anaerolineae bacterium]